MANFDLLEYQKRVIADLTAENKALKEQIEELNRLKAELKQAQNRLHDSMQYIPKKCSVCNIVKAMERITGNGKEQKTNGNTHIKIQYHNEELTIQEICERLEMAEKAKHSLIAFLKGSCMACVKRYDCNTRRGSHERCWKFDYFLIGED